MTLQYRFRIKYKIQDNGCWIWLASKRNGYGQFSIGNKVYFAHRVARYIYCGFNLDSEIQINHKPDKCNNTACINPEHTYEGTQTENNRDTVKSGNHHEANKTHCPNGHEYTLENIYYGSKGDRNCRKCCGYKNKKEIWRRMRPA